MVVHRTNYGYGRENGAMYRFSCRSWVLTTRSSVKSIVVSDRGAGRRHGSGSSQNQAVWTFFLSKIVTCHACFLRTHSPAPSFHVTLVRGHVAPPPLPRLWSVPSTLSREGFNVFFPARLASNCYLFPPENAAPPPPIFVSCVLVLVGGPS